MTGTPILDGVRGIQIPEASTKLQSVAVGHVERDADRRSISSPSCKANANLQITPYEKGITYNVVMRLHA